MATPLSKHFTREELACPCCGVCNVDATLLIAAEELREIVKRPLVSTSCFRCEKHNAKVGGAKASEHPLGRAMDLKTPKGMDIVDFYAVVCKVPAFAKSGIGLYPQEGFIHVDVKRPKPARWARVKGTYVSIDEGIKEAIKLTKKSKGKKA